MEYAQQQRHLAGDVGYYNIKYFPYVSFAHNDVNKPDPITQK